MQSVDELLGQLRGVTGPEGVPPPEPFAWQPWVIGTGALVLVFVAWRWYRRPRPLLPPNVEALAALKALPIVPTTAVMATGEQIVRRYLERQKGLPSQVATPIELNGCLDDRWREALLSLQTQRFAPAQSSPDEWSRLVRQLESLIQDDCGNAADQ